METIQVVLDKELLQAADRAARLGLRALEKRDREGYARQPQTQRESYTWEAKAAWPPA